MKRGIFILRGKSLEPPHVVRQEADRIFVNDQQIYPFPEIEKPKKIPPKEPEFQVPKKIQETLTDFQKSWESGLVRDEKGIVEKASGLKRDKDFIKDREDKIMDADAFIEDYQFEKEALKDVLKSRDIPFIETEKYHDILVPVGNEWGIIALFNEAERMRVAAEIDREKPVPLKYSYRDAAKFRKYIEAGLKAGDMVVVDENYMEFIPRSVVDEAAERIPGYETLSDKERAERLKEEVALEKIPTGLKTGLILFPHFSWQKEFAGSSRFPFSLAAKLRDRGYRVFVFLDTSVTLATWAHYLQNGKNFNVKVIYNQGHGNANLISVGEPRLKRGWYYFTDQFVYRFANLDRSVIYIHSCGTLSDDRLAVAFLKKGGCTYGGWKMVTSSNPAYCDRVDGIFWRVLVDQNGSTGQACRALNEYESRFECRGDPHCRIP